MDESVAVAYPEGALGRRPQETSRSAPEPRGGSGSLHLPDARASVWDRVGHRAETRRDHRSATSRGAGRTTGLDSGRQHDLRSAILETQPVLGLHGHIHETKNAAKLKRTVCVDPGSEYNSGTLRGAIVNPSGTACWAISSRPADPVA